MNEPPMDDVFNKFLALLFVTALAAVLMVTETIWSGYVGSVLWSWYAIPLGAPALSWGSCSGVLLARALFYRFKYIKEGQPKFWTQYLSYAFLVPAMILLAGWLIKTYGTITIWTGEIRP